MPQLVKPRTTPLRLRMMLPAVFAILEALGQQGEQGLLGRMEAYSLTSFNRPGRTCHAR